MLFQIRDDDPAVIERLEQLLRTMADEATAQGRCGVTLERIRTGAPAMMDRDIPGRDRSGEHSLRRRQVDPHAQRRRP